MLFGVAYIVYWIITAKTIPELLQIKIGIVISIIEVVGIPTLTIVWKKLFCELNKEEINKRVKIKLEKRYNDYIEYNGRRESGNEMIGGLYRWSGCK